MEKYQGVAITDGVNRKNHILPLNAIIKAYRDTWGRCCSDKSSGHEVLKKSRIKSGKI